MRSSSSADRSSAGKAPRERDSSWRAATSSQTAPPSRPPSRARPCSHWAAVAASRLEERRGGVAFAPDEVDGARHEGRGAAPAQGAAPRPAPLRGCRGCGSSRGGDGGAGSHARSIPSPARAAEELGKVIAGDVLHDLAGVGDGAVGEHDGHPEDEIARTSVAVGARSEEVAGDRSADRRSPGGSSASIWPCSAKAR